jgi:hypothetical protein
LHSSHCRRNASSSARFSKDVSGDGPLAQPKISGFQTESPVKNLKWKNPLRLNQFYMAKMTADAASLTGAKGEALKREAITVGAKQVKATSGFHNWEKGAKKSTISSTMQKE